jgi:thioredoxin 1
MKPSLQATFALVFTIVLFLSSINVHAQIKFIDHEPDSIFDIAKAEGKYLFIDFRASWCLPCKQMEKTTFQDSTLSQFVNNKMVSYKADTDFKKNRKLKYKYQVHDLPTILVIDPKHPDKPLLRVIGFTPATILLDDLKAIRNSDGEKVFK